MTSSACTALHGAELRPPQPSILQSSCTKLQTGTIVIYLTAHTDRRRDEEREDAAGSDVALSPNHVPVTPTRTYVPAPLRNLDCSSEHGRPRSDAHHIARPRDARRRLYRGPASDPLPFRSSRFSQAAKGENPVSPDSPQVPELEAPVRFARDGGAEHAGEAEAEAAGVRARCGGAGGAVRRGALRARQGPRRPAPPRRRRRRLRRQGRRRPRLRPLPRPPPRPPRLRRPQGGRRGAGGGPAPPVDGQGRISQSVRGGQGDRRGGAAVRRDRRGSPRVRQGGAGGQGRVREDRAGGQGPVRALRAGGGAPGRLHLALAQQAAAVPAGGADRRAHRGLLVREVQQGDRLRGPARARRSPVPPGHPHRAHRQGVRGGVAGDRVVRVQAHGTLRDRRGRVVVGGRVVGVQA